MGYFLLLDRHPRDMLYKDTYCIYLKDLKQIPQFVKTFCEKNRIEIKEGSVNIDQLLKDHKGIHKQRRQNEKEKTGS